MILSLARESPAAPLAVGQGDGLDELVERRLDAEHGALHLLATEGERRGNLAGRNQVADCLEVVQVFAPSLDGQAETHFFGPVLGFSRGRAVSILPAVAVPSVPETIVEAELFRDPGDFRGDSKPNHRF